MDPIATPLRLAARTAEYHQRMEQRRHDLARHLGPLWEASKAFTWEIGCGHGHYLTAYAAAHPDQLCIGIDITGERIDRALRKRDRARLANLHFVRADARQFLEVIPAGVEFSRLFILFPDPWPKVRHHKHRVLQAEFLSAVAPRATAEARLYFRTDYVPYFEAARSILDRHDAWEMTPESWHFEYGTVFQARAADHRSLIARRRPSSPRIISSTVT